MEASFSNALFRSVFALVFTTCPLLRTSSRNWVYIGDLRILSSMSSSYLTSLASAASAPFSISALISAAAAMFLSRFASCSALSCLSFQSFTSCVPVNFPSALLDVVFFKSSKVSGLSPPVTWSYADGLPLLLGLSAGGCNKSLNSWASGSVPPASILAPSGSVWVGGWRLSNLA